MVFEVDDECIGAAWLCMVSTITGDADANSSRGTRENSPFMIGKSVRKFNCQGTSEHC